MDTKLLFVDSGAAAVQLSTELRGKDYFRSNFGNLAILAAIRRASSLVRSLAAECASAMRRHTRQHRAPS
jgi:hypothetical protein